ncbi:protein UL145 [Saimiriine betaherpesvirus 4]|uniref:Protein UL145 n=1 Tax=Saimiriine betaherpesvirus 4 TaxID=1535247 RepID=G8XT31_9BETA|nr:protein UL145 [Saimiriine betaherpesvirus 4]AEV80977.1 protein UL145 [Saimiriine betaherpesvirus 4]
MTTRRRLLPHNTTDLLCKRPRDGPGRWERLIDHVSLIQDSSLSATLVAGSDNCFILLEREGAFAAFHKGLIPEKTRAKLKGSEWIPGAWIVAETFPDDRVYICTFPETSSCSTSSEIHRE